MINGDIDLTENLDFRNDKPEDHDGHEIVPWKTGGTIKMYTKDDDSNFITTTVDSIITTTVNVSNTNLYNRNNRIYNFNNNDLYQTYTTYDTYISNPFISSDISYITNSTNYNVYTVTDSWMGATYSFGYNNNKLVIYDAENSHPGDYDKDIFGYDIRVEKSKKSICPYCGRLGDHNYGCITKDNDEDTNNNFILMIENAKKDKEYDSIYNEYDYVPWNDKNEECKSLISKRLCPWMDKLHHRIYTDYMIDLFEEQDYSHYLTDLTWLGL